MASSSRGNDGRGKGRQKRSQPTGGQVRRRGDAGAATRGSGRRREQPKPKRPTRPELPPGRPHLDKDVYRDLRGTAKAEELPHVMQAYAAAGEALAGGDLERAVELLTWAKSVAPRSPSIREALGVARYLRGDYAGAYRDLLTYRRLSGRRDQNHLLADCARAAGRHDEVAEYIDEMFEARVAPDRLAEGLLVLAGDRADSGDLRGALDALTRMELDPLDVQPWHPRLWYLAGDLWERLGDLDRARDYFDAITAVDDDFLDTSDRLEALSQQ